MTTASQKQKTKANKPELMKLASLKSGRDGRLVVVSEDLHWYTDASHIAPTLQAALASWQAWRQQLRADAAPREAAEAARPFADASRHVA